jgi:hypothetical protein
MNNALKALALCGDAGSLGAVLRALCSEFGSVSRLNILTMTDAGRRKAVCLLRPASSEEKQELMKSSEQTGSAKTYMSSSTCVCRPSRKRK